MYVTIAFVNEEYKAKQVEFLLGIKLKKKQKNQLGRLSHLTMNNEWIMKVLIYLKKDVSDIKYADDRKVLEDEFRKSKKYKHLLVKKRAK
jgi:hypothetical protein